MPNEAPKARKFQLGVCPRKLRGFVCFKTKTRLKLYLFTNDFVLLFKDLLTGFWHERKNSSFARPPFCFKYPDWTFQSGGAAMRGGEDDSKLYMYFQSGLQNWHESERWVWRIRYNFYIARNTKGGKKRYGCKKKFIKKIFINLNRFANSLRHQFVLYVSAPCTYDLRKSRLCT